MVILGGGGASYGRGTHVLNLTGSVDSVRFVDYCLASEGAALAVSSMVMRLLHISWRSLFSFAFVFTWSNVKKVKFQTRDLCSHLP